MTALMWAAEVGNRCNLEILLNAGGDPTIYDKCGLTAMDYAALAREYFRYVEETEEVPWKTDRFEARPIDLKEKEIPVKEKCARVAQRLQGRVSDESGRAS